MNIWDIAPYLGATGDVLVNLDENKTGADDFAGESLIYAADVIVAISGSLDLPPFPAALAKGTSEKITGVSRASLMVASSILTVAQFQVAGKAALILKYVNQALRNLLAGVPVPAPPTTLTK